VLLGLSGCGKTTLVRIMAGLERRTSGELSIARTDGGKPLTAMVFQEDSVFPWMTVEENIGYGLRLRSAPGPDVTRTVGGYIEKVGLTRFAGAYPFQLSGGMKKRVSVARAFAADCAAAVREVSLARGALAALHSGAVPSDPAGRLGLEAH